jgi:hypothetical protein
MNEDTKIRPITTVMTTLLLFVMLVIGCVEGFLFGDVVLHIATASTLWILIVFLSFVPIGGLFIYWVVGHMTMEWLTKCDISFYSGLTFLVIFNIMYIVNAFIYMVDRER